MTLLVRTDASAEIGVGHLMRCVALAQAWQSHGGQVVFVMAEATDEIRARLRDEGFSIRRITTAVGSADDSVQTLSIAEKIGSDWVVVDGYRFGSAYQLSLKTGGIRQLFIDDCGNVGQYHADLILNQNIHAEASLYPLRGPSVRLLLGLEYLLLRREFLDCPNEESLISPKAQHLLITFGGSDPDNVTGKVLESLQSLNDRKLHICVVSGPTNPHYAVLKKICQNSRFTVRLLSTVADMARLYHWADLAITGGGSTLWELAYMGVPALTLILFENQAPSSRRLDQYGCIQCLGYPNETDQYTIAQAVENLVEDSMRRHRMAVCGQRLIDGKGALRVLNQMQVDL